MLLFQWYYLNLSLYNLKFIILQISESYSCLDIPAFFVHFTFWFVERLIQFINLNQQWNIYQNVWCKSDWSYNYI